MNSRMHCINLQGVSLYPHKILSARMRRSFMWWNYMYIMELAFPATPRQKTLKNRVRKIKYRTFKDVEADRQILEKEGVNVYDYMFWF